MKLIVFTITALLPGLSLVSGAKTWAKGKKGMCCKSTLDACHKLGYWGCAVSDRSYCVRETSGLHGPTAWCNESCLESENSEGVDARDAKDYITDGGAFEPTLSVHDKSRIQVARLVLADESYFYRRPRLDYPDDALRRSYTCRHKEQTYNLMRIRRLIFRISSILVPYTKLPSTNFDA
ncbi:uncharacterized protein MYCGRDRAFT_94232 [Zymoseptoria tritici IPO323]|uniref:WSC domain-containing protein n=1 Tax=Zymoseptoria tritici (strain CBS 115943 / IPO323) TaxID=336722 RepID=F9XGF3_ZYMTI|nr:uncharacterized protein MYCGRDRAFT_94232 [Zymoseptoria tritici IPO323]EGP86275.1 hypothetical protein MYCGRDRAFT_94232 [Zymoseptoria tritici IPO323]